MSAESEVVTIVKRLSTYLRQNPKAGDTLEGIECWWIGRAIHPTAGAVEAALDWMERCGAVVAVRTADGRVHYRCRRDIDDLDMRLQALELDPYALLPASPGGPSPARIS